MASVNTKDVDFIDEFSFESSCKGTNDNQGHPTGISLQCQDTVSGTDVPRNSRSSGVGLEFNVNGTVDAGRIDTRSPSVNVLVPIPLPFMTVCVYRSTGILPVIKPAEPDDSTENTIVISKKPRPSNARRPLPITEFPPEIPLDCRTSKVKLRAYFRKHEGKYPTEHINAMYILARRASNVKASQRNRAKAKELAQRSKINVAGAQPN